MLILAPIVAPIAAGCGSSAGSSPNPIDAAKPVDAAVCNGVTSTSTADDAHVHTVCVPTADLTSPPASGATYVSSNDFAHTHKITLTSAQLASIQAGQSVTVESTSEVDPINGDVHTHRWTVKTA